MKTAALFVADKNPDKFAYRIAYIEKAFAVYYVSFKAILHVCRYVSLLPKIAFVLASNLFSILRMISHDLKSKIQIRFSRLKKKL